MASAGSTGALAPRTRSAVGWFQRKHGLSVDGIAGPRTLERLRERQRVDSTTTDRQPQAQADPQASVPDDVQAPRPATPAGSESVGRPIRVSAGWWRRSPSG